MSLRYLARPGVLAVPVVAALLIAGGQTGRTQDVDDASLRTVWDEPDLRGVWRNETETPFERPDELAGKEFYTEEEAAALVEGRCGTSSYRSARTGGRPPRARARRPTHSRPAPTTVSGRTWASRSGCSPARR